MAVTEGNGLKNKGTNIYYLTGRVFNVSWISLTLFVLFTLLFSTVSETDKNQFQIYQQNIPHIPSIKVGATMRTCQQLSRAQTSDKLSGYKYLALPYSKVYSGTSILVDLILFRS